MKYLNVSNEKVKKLSGIGLGSTRIVADPEEGIRTIHAALDAGINYLNTADFYSHGLAELIIRDALKSRKREEAFISLKFGGLISPDGVFYGIDNRPEHIKNYLAYSLKRLGTDYVDLYQPARIDPNIPVEETIGMIADLVKQGYVKHIGLSQVNAQTLRRANTVHPISLVEMQYSLLNRDIEDELLPAARELGIGIVAYGILFSGLMGNNTRDERLSHLGKVITTNNITQLNSSLTRVDELKKIADEKGISVAQLAIAWILAQGEDILALVGARKVTQIQDSIKAVHVSLSEDDLKRIEKIIPKSETSGYYGLKMDIDKNGLFR